MQYFKDGNKTCCVEIGFRNLQEDNAGFGDTKKEAFIDFCTGQGDVYKFKQPTRNLNSNEMRWYMELTGTAA